MSLLAKEYPRRVRIVVLSDRHSTKLYAPICLGWTGPVGVLETAAVVVEAVVLVVADDRLVVLGLTTW